MGGQKGGFGVKKGDLGSKRGIWGQKGGFGVKKGDLESKRGIWGQKGGFGVLGAYHFDTFACRLYQDFLIVGINPTNIWFSLVLEHFWAVITEI